MARLTFAQARDRVRVESGRLLATLVSAENEDGTEFSLPTVGSKPAAADILNGQINAIGTIITIPAGRTWRGSITIAGSVSVAPGGAAVVAVPNVKVNGAGAVPTAGVIVAILPLTVPAVGATATNGSALSGSVTIPTLVAIAPANNAITVDFDPSLATARGIAIGQLL